MLPRERMPAPLFTLVIVTALSLTNASLVSAQPLAGQAAATCSNGELPPNVQVHGVLLPAASSLLQKSALFVSQCERVARALHVRVSVTLNPRIPLTLYRATTNFRRFSSGLIIAEIELGLVYDYDALLAHEFEHVLEQLDGWVLPHLVNVRSAGVTKLFTGAFETQRAIDAGLAASREVRRHDSSRSMADR